MPPSALAVFVLKSDVWLVTCKMAQPSIMTELLCRRSKLSNAANFFWLRASAHEMTWGWCITAYIVRSSKGATDFEVNWLLLVGGILFMPVFAQRRSN